MGFGDIVYQMFLEPWYDSLKTPAQSQQDVLLKLLEIYAETSYGKGHGASEVSSIEEFRENFPKTSYPQLKPYFEKVKRGNYNSILAETPEIWVMTRGSTGASKVIPLTRTHLDQVRSCGARAILNYSARHKDSKILAGRVLNLNFPSIVKTMKVGSRDVSYGYSSGTYARLIPNLNETSLIPRQEDIDALGPGIGKEDWNARFELAYEKSKEENVTSIMGVAPVISSFARYVKRTYGLYPKEMWRMLAIFCTSVPKIHTRYAPRLKKYYGRAPIIEMYTATEGVYGQQLDDLPYISPNYDTYLFEVEMGSRTKMLYEMERGQWGRLIISSCLFPRYEIGDMIECMGKHYFRVFGRDRLRVVLEHRLYRLLTRWFI